MGTDMWQCHGQSAVEASGQVAGVRMPDGIDARRPLVRIRPRKSIPSEMFVFTSPRSITVPEISLLIDGTDQTFPAGTTGTDVYCQDRSVVAVRVDGDLRDLAAELPAGARVEPVRIDSPDGLNILRHSAAHVLAQAVQQVRPEAKLGIGPPVVDGFYYDFDVSEPFTPEDLKALETAMRRIIKEGQKFRRREVTESEAREELGDEPYKLELIGLKGPGSADAAEGAAVEVGEGELTIYDNLRRDGEVAWKDLCRGPHLPTTKLIGKGFSLMRSAAAYWRGSEANPQLQRIYGTAWPTKDELVAYKNRLAEAERRDHRRLGSELDLFSFPEEVGSGLPVDRKSTRLNSSHVAISYAVFCLKKNTYPVIKEAVKM